MSNNQSLPRHWHGTIGDRYEHHNVWVTGGPPQPFIAKRPSVSSTTTTTSDRRDSDASTMSTNSASGTVPPVPAPERRRSSTQGPSSLFESLTNQKRNLNDGNLAARRQSWNEQSQQGGFFSKWWEGYTRGSK